MAPIPLEGRYGGLWRNFTVWFTPNMEISGVFTGTIAISLGLSVWQGLVAVVLGVAVGAVPVAVLSRLGPQTGMAQLPLARLPFGKTISVPAAVQWFSSIMWDALVGFFGGQALAALLNIPFAAGVIIVLAIQGALGFIGYEAIHQFEKWAALVAAAFFLLLAFRVVQHGNFPTESTVQGSGAVGAWLLMFAISISLGIGWASYASDYSRYMKPDTDVSKVAWLTFAGLFVSYVWVVVIGLLAGTILTNQTAQGVRDLMDNTALGYVALIAMSVGAVASNCMNDYSGSLAFQAAGIKIRRPWVALLVTIIAFVLIMWMNSGDLVGKFTDLVLFTGYWVAPFSAIVLLDWIQVRRELTPREIERLIHFQKLDSGWIALISLLGGFGAMIPFMNTTLVMGPVASALNGADVSFFVGFIVALVLFYVLNKVFRTPSAGQLTSFGKPHQSRLGRERNDAGQRRSN
ncbi:MAG: cytosine permease [Candidatus Nanopelagicales bacterium]